MSDTPRTDQQTPNTQGLRTLVVTAEFARELERELNESREVIDALKRTLRLTQDANEELQWQLDGYTKCEVCKGDCGRYEGFQTTPQPDPQTWVDCRACDGEGWVK